MGDAPILELTDQVKALLIDTANKLKGSDRRTFMAHTVGLLGRGGQRQAERELGWNRTTIRKGQREREAGAPSPDNFAARGRKKAEEHLPNLLDDMRAIVEPESQIDPTFKTTQKYTRLTAKEVRRRLIDDKGYTDEALPTARTLNTKLNALGYRPQKVAKSKPVKKIPETDAIFEQLHAVNQTADATPGVQRLSIDSKATIKIGPFARGGKNRKPVAAVDHDFDPQATLTLFGIFLPAVDETFLFATTGQVTADFMVDALESIWPEFQERFQVHELVINADNGSENSSRRTQFIKRLVTFAQAHDVKIQLAHYPPYHSKYNPIERVWGVLENHWQGELLDSIEKVLGFAESMTYNGHHPVVRLVDKPYETGVKLSKRAMAAYEAMLQRLAGLENWFVEIVPSPA